MTTISETVQCFSCEMKFQSFKSLTNDEVFRLIKSGSIRSCSLNPLPASIMAKCCHTLLPMPTRIINLSLATCEMSAVLKCAMLQPFLKKPTSDHKVFANFRPVSNFKYISKVIEKAVAAQLNDHLACNNLHAPFQSAYTVCHSTESALMKVHKDIMISLDNGNSVILVLLDLSGYFDTVNLDLLLSRLDGHCSSGSSPMFVVLHSLSLSINLTRRNVTCFLEYHRALFCDPYSICYILLLFLMSSPTANLITTFMPMILNFIWPSKQIM